MFWAPRRTVVKEVILTPDGYKKLQAEIEELSTVRRREVADRIRIAREFGDIAENAEYDSAKNDQAHLESRIAVLEERLANARGGTKKEITAAQKRGGGAAGAKGKPKGMGPNKQIEDHNAGAGG